MAQETQTFRYSNETFSGCDMVASISISNQVYNSTTGGYETKTYNKVLGELTTLSYSIHMEKRPIRSIGNVNAKDYVMGPRTIAGSLVFSVFNKHFSQDLVDNINYDNAKGTVYLVDELPPFNIIISAANEYGYRSRLVLYGIRLLNEGQVMSVNDVYTENTYQFFATDLEYLTDEMTYTRSSTDRLYKLTDTIDFVETADMNYFNIVSNGETDSKTYLESIATMNVRLSATVKNPTRSSSKGIVKFFLDPGQVDGIIYVTDEDDDVTKITIKSDDENTGITYASSSFSSGTYTAYFKNSAGTKSNTIKFTVKKYTSSSTTLITPTIEKITSESAYVYTSSSKHDKVLYTNLTTGDQDKKSISSKKCKLTDLDENTTYSVRTYCSEDEDSSATVTFTTLGDMQAYEDLITYLKANKTALGITDVTDYVDIVEDSEDADLTPADSISKMKSAFQNQLSTLDLGSDTYKEDKAELETKISECALILTAAIKMNNDTTTAVNKSNNVPAPTMLLDENYDHCFQFDENITSCEFYREYGGIEQFTSVVQSYNFKTIDDKTNCVRFKGKEGYTYYVQAIISNVRSSKVEFYVMTTAEKQEYIASQTAKDTLSSSDISKLNATVSNDLSDNVSTLDEQRAFMINAKAISDDKVMAPVVISIDTNVTVETFLSNLSSNPETFYLAIATYEDVVYNNDIYKIPFTCSDKTITITPLYNGIIENTAYCLWIEDKDNNQISDASSFSYIPGTEVADDITKYEVEDFITIINNLAKKDLSTDICETIQATIENNESITANEIVSSAIEIVTSNAMNKTNMLNFLYNLRSYIGIFLTPDDTFFSNINYNTSSISFDSSRTGTILIYDLDQMDNMTLSSTNTISLNNYQSNIIVLVAIEDSFNSKSNILVINKTDKYMEVL